MAGGALSFTTGVLVNSESKPAGGPDPFIIHTSTCPPTNLGPKPFLFGTSDEGEVYFWDWVGKAWKLIEEIDV